MEAPTRVVLFEGKPLFPLVTLRKDLFNEGSLGYSLFPDSLEGLKRTVCLEEKLEWYKLYSPIKRKTLDPAKSGFYPLFYNKVLRGKLSEAGIETLSVLLNKKEEDLPLDEDGVACIKKYIEFFYEQLFLGPEGLLLWAVGGSKPDMNAEEDRARARELVGRLADLRPEEKAILRLRFGFDNGNPKTFKGIESEFNMRREGEKRINKIGETALKKLRS